jgi:two-component system, NarL family, response regulator NreC
MSAETIRILLVDDHQILREGLRALLESEDDLRVIAETGLGKEAIRLATEIRPEMIIMDLGLPDMNGLDAIQAIRQENPACRIVVLSMHSQRDFVLRAVELGCDGYVPKSSAHTSLMEAIRVVLSGERYLHPKIASILVEAITRGRSEAEQFAALSEREQEVLLKTALGFNSREISDELTLSSKTVETYRQRAMEKLGLEHRSDLVRFALRAGLLEGYSQ